MVEMIVAIAIGTGVTALLTALFPAENTEVKAISVEEYRISKGKM